MTPVWFITGASRGLGAAVANEALEKGYKVVAGARNPQTAAKVLGSNPNLHIVALDICDDTQVQLAVESAMATFGRIDVLVNNAGYGQLSCFEETSEKMIRQQMETNVFGTMKITRAVLPILRKQGSGMVAVITSTSGIRAVRGGSIYSASKFALEGWAEGLSIDLKPFGIHCMLVEPGAFRTDFLDDASVSYGDIKIADYQQQRKALEEHFVKANHAQPGDPRKFAKALMTAVQAPNPPLHFVVEKNAVNIIDAYFTERRAEFEAWRTVASDTDFTD